MFTVSTRLPPLYGWLGGGGVLMVKVDGGGARKCGVEKILCLILPKKILSSPLKSQLRIKLGNIHKVHMNKHMDRYTYTHDRLFKSRLAYE